MMKSTVIFFVFLLLISSVYSQQSGKYVLAIHGGAGYVNPDIPGTLVDAYQASLERALRIGEEILKQGGTSLNAVEAVVKFLEDDSLFNAGRGGVLTDAGTVELDAAIMDGNTLASGAVTGVTTVKNPVSLARLVMEKTPHIFLSAVGAERFADSMKVERVPNDWFITPGRKLDYMRRIAEKQGGGTVGAVALDLYGNLAAATSTGGMMMKMQGRIGDAPVIGAGTYAENQTCAISCTGKGEKFIRHSVAATIANLMKYAGLPLQQAAKKVLYEVLSEGDGGLVAVDRNGNYELLFSTPSMFRGVVTSDGIFETGIWKK